jgi:hypothetical protein
VDEERATFIKIMRHAVGRGEKLGPQVRPVSLQCLATTIIAFYGWGQKLVITGREDSRGRQRGFDY